MDQALAAAQQRAQEIASTVADSAATSSQALESQFEQVRSASSAERERMSEMLRGTYQQAMGEVNRLFEDTAAASRKSPATQGRRP